MTLVPEITPVEQLEKRVAELEKVLRAKDQQLNALTVTLRSSQIGSQKSVNQASQQPRNLLQLVLNTIPARVFWKNRQGVFLGCNQRGAEDLGLASPEVIIGKTDYDFVPYENAESFRKDDLAVMDSGIPKLNFEEMQQRPDGSARWIRTSKVPMYDATGSVMGIMLTYDDITERKLAEEAVRESRNLLQLVLDTIPVRVFWKDNNLNYLGCNRLFASDAKLDSPDTIIGKNDYELFSAEAELYRADDRQVISSGVQKLNFEEPQSLPDGSQIWLRTSKIPLRNARGEIIGVMGTYDDITERKLAEEAVGESRNLLQLVLDTIPVRVFWKDNNLNYLGCNSLFASDAKLDSPDTIIGKNDYELFSAEAELYRADDRQVISSGVQKLNFEEPQSLPDGSQIWLRTSKIPLRNARGEVIGVMGTYDDITQRKVAEQQREKLLVSEQEARREAQEALRLKDLFLATMSHELRTPLNAMIGFQHLMLYSGQLSEDNIHMTERTIANSQRLLNLINNILDISRIATGGLKIVPVKMSPRQLASGILTDLCLLAKERGLELKIEVEDSVPETIIHEEERLGQIALNLVNNAIKFTESGSVEMHMLREDDQLIIRVKDTGIGIPASKQHVVFDDFVQVDNSSTRKHQGAGLGLAIVKRLVLLMQGSIQLESEIGQGSTFTVALPLNLKVTS